MRQRFIGMGPRENDTITSKKHHFHLLSFGDLFGDEYDHPFNEEIDEVLMQWPADDWQKVIREVFNLNKRSIWL